MDRSQRTDAKADPGPHHYHLKSPVVLRRPQKQCLLQYLVLYTAVLRLIQRQGQVWARTRQRSCMWHTTEDNRHFFNDTGLWVPHTCHHVHVWGMHKCCKLT